MSEKGKYRDGVLLIFVVHVADISRANVSSVLNGVPDSWSINFPASPPITFHFLPTLSRRKIFSPQELQVIPSHPS